MSIQAVKGTCLKNKRIMLHGFESHLIHHALLAQLVERLSFELVVVSSNLTESSCPHGAIG